MENRKYFFTSESVSEGHPDKLCDQISDAVLDKCLEGDPESRVACETYAATGMVLVGGEITTHSFVDIQKVVRDLVKKIGYTKSEYGLDYESMAVMNIINSQSPDISQGVTAGEGVYREQGAGDQGMMFGYATTETPELMPAPIMYSHKLLREAAALRHKGEIKWMRPDSKSQVTIEYEKGSPKRIDAVVISHQHNT
ncbi:MAG: methionine adenosyltransferase, partial [Spirochaetales bacterium]|nr:methionine adenosyltransferase [Spirochaetales bacterium]